MHFFSIRVTDPETTPGIRSLGGFVRRNEFAALTWDLRENIALFDDEAAIVEAAWRGLFGNEKANPNGSAGKGLLTVRRISGVTNTVRAVSYPVKSDGSSISRSASSNC